MATEASCSTSTSSSSPSKAERDAAIEAFNHLIQGKRHLLVQDIPSAVSSLEEACQLLTTHYGELANECGDAYFYYGKALFELAREETGVLGNAIGNEEEKDDDDDDEDEDDNEDSNGNDEDGQEESQEEEEQSDKSEELVDEDKENKPSSNESEASENVKPSSEEPDQPVAGTSSGKTEDKDEESEEITNLQLAWEMLELAKVIFARQAENNREMQLKLAEVYLCLGEVSLECGNYSIAVDDMKHCLEVQQSLLPKDDRRIAETFYQLGLTYSFYNSNDLAIESFCNACSVIEDKIASLKLITQGKELDPANVLMNDDPVAVAQREIQDLTAILPDLRDKITDLEEAKKNPALMAQKMAEKTTKPAEPVEESIGQISSTSSSSKSEKPTSNISHLIKRKRKPDGPSEVLKPLSILKKARADELPTSNVCVPQPCDSNETSTYVELDSNSDNKSNVESSSEAKCSKGEGDRIESPHSSTVDSSADTSEKTISSSQKEPDTSCSDSKCPVSSSSMKDERSVLSSSSDKLCNGNRDSAEVQ